MLIPKKKNTHSQFIQHHIVFIIHLRTKSVIWFISLSNNHPDYIHPLARFCTSFALTNHKQHHYFAKTMRSIRIYLIFILFEHLPSSKFDKNSTDFYTFTHKKSLNCPKVTRCIFLYNVCTVNSPNEVHLVL